MPFYPCPGYHKECLSLREVWTPPGLPSSSRWPSPRAPGFRCFSKHVSSYSWVGPDWRQMLGTLSTKGIRTVLEISPILQILRNSSISKLKTMQQCLHVKLKMIIVTSWNLINPKWALWQGQLYSWYNSIDLSDEHSPETLWINCSLCEKSYYAFKLVLLNHATYSTFWFSNY